MSGYSSSPRKQSDEPSGSGDSNDTTGPGVDGITDSLEDYLVTDGAASPVTHQTDSDMDGLPDFVEVTMTGSDPFDGESPTAMGGGDSNDSTSPAGDRISDAVESFLVDGGGTAPITDMGDTDGDGIADVTELQSGTDPSPRQKLRTSTPTTLTVANRSAAHFQTGSRFPSGTTAA